MSLYYCSEHTDNADIRCLTCKSAQEWIEKDMTIAALQDRIEEIIEDIRMACGCTDGDDIRNHLAEYLDE